MLQAMTFIDPQTQLTPHFRLGEFTDSATATEHGITIRVVDGSSVHGNLIALATEVLEPLRYALGAPVRITSGYRPKQVNVLVGGAPTSQHIAGEAADIVVDGHTPLAVAETIQRLGLPVDQCIHEFARWVHVSYSTHERREYLTAYTGADGGTRYAAGLHRIEELSS